MKLLHFRGSCGAGISSSIVANCGHLSRIWALECAWVPNAPATTRPVSRAPGSAFAVPPESARPCGPTRAASAKLELTRLRGHLIAWAARLGQEGCPDATNPTPV